jgi:hypothetical protein
MKNKLLYISVIVLSFTLLTSCASRKYGCPNSTGMKVEAKAQAVNA